MQLSAIEQYETDRRSQLLASVSRLPVNVQRSKPTLEGKLTRIVGLTIEAVGCQASVGSRCEIVSPKGHRAEAEVVGFEEGRLYLMPLDPLQGIEPGARVIPVEHDEGVAVGPGLLGRVIDGAGRALDERGPVFAVDRAPLEGERLNPLKRKPITDVFDVGIRAVNALMTVGRGQRLGLFAGSGVGKSTLLGLMTRYSEADVVVVGLIGERGREVQEFIDHILGEAGLKRAVVVATPADSPPLMRLHGALRATAIAEYFRGQGKNVLLLMDSLTRFAQAQREIALSIGEMPVSRGFPPSVFAKLPQLVERAGNDRGPGSLTAIYTILVEGDDLDDPVADASRAILDGHIVLSRTLAESGLYPAIDIDKSVSRLMTQVASETQVEAARKVRSISALYEQNRDLISVGAYTEGSDPRIDLAVAANPAIRQFIQQGLDEQVTFAASNETLTKFVEMVGQFEASQAENQAQQNPPA
jgi:flagellum-specific ATP synthase